MEYSGLPYVWETVGICAKKCPKTRGDRGFRALCHGLARVKATQTRIGIFNTNEENEKFKNLDGVSSNVSPIEGGTGQEEPALRGVKV